MPQTLTVSEIANIIGAEEAIIQRIFERRDEDLVAYLRDPPNNQSATASEEEESVKTSSAQTQTPLLDLEGLPTLITKLAL